MGQKIIRFELEGTAALGFDTGLSSQAFAQAKLSQFINRTGYLVDPGGEFPPPQNAAAPENSAYRLWQVRGSIERDGAMIIWGPAFAGERLDLLIQDDTRRDAALDALRYWIRARIILGTLKNPPYPWPAGAIISWEGTILFPPDQLIRRSVNAEGPEAWLKSAERWVHPDLSGDEAAVFAAGTMLYRIFCGSPPFPNGDINLVRQDIREGVFFPPWLAAPGLDHDLALLLAQSIAPSSFFMPEHGAPGPKPAGDNPPKNKFSRRFGNPGAGVFSGRKTRPSLKDLGEFLGPPRSREVDTYFHPLSGLEREKICRKRNRFHKKKEISVGIKRFMRRNSIILGVVLFTVLILGVIVQGIRRDRAGMPTTKGMSPGEVVQAYYNAFGALDHALMDACVIRQAGKEDITLVQNLFITSRVRQAYEGIIPVQDAQEWINAGFPATEAFVFGVSDLEFQFLDKDETDGEVRVRASYKFWDSANPDRPSAANSRRDKLRLIFYKDAWRIAEIRRTSLP
jgi:hypothetical protein